MRTIFQFRCGVRPSLKSSEFLKYRIAVDAVSLRWRLSSFVVLVVWGISHAFPLSICRCIQILEMPSLVSSIEVLRMVRFIFVMVMLFY